MKDKDFIVFIEVKSIAENSGFSIYESLTSEKKRRISKAINKWLLEHNMLDEPWRFDFVGIVLNGEEVRSFDHFQFVEL